jgi:hypothetical protein
MTFTCYSLSRYRAMQYWVLVYRQAFLVALRGVVDGDKRAKASGERLRACKSRVMS